MDAMLIFAQALGIGLVAMVGYALLVNRLVAATDGLRNTLAYRGEELLLSRRLTKGGERTLTVMLDHAMNSWAMLILVILIPIAATMTIFGVGPKVEPEKDKEAQVEAGFLAALFWAVNGATNPICAGVVFIEIVIFSLFMTAGKKWVDFAVRLNALSYRMAIAGARHA